ncbi:MAG: hypothetical protein SGPRY_010577, partial [Prymnesium sp.]
VTVCFFVFDLLHLDGHQLALSSLADRRALLRQHVAPLPGVLAFAEGELVESRQSLEASLAASVASGGEGLMCKALDGLYEPGKRSLQWLKLKKDYLTALGDSLDLVVVGAYMGEGKRRGAFGAYLMASYDPSSNRYQPIGKLGSGFSDAQLDEWNTYFTSREPSSDPPPPEWRLDLPPSGLPPQYSPHVWLQPHVVRAASLSISPVFRAARGSFSSAEKGLAVRFPRFIRERPDKQATDASTSEQLASMFAQQPEGALDLGYQEPPAAEEGEVETIEELPASLAGAAASSKQRREEHPTIRGIKPTKTGHSFWQASVDGSDVIVRFGKVCSCFPWLLQPSMYPYLPAMIVQVGSKGHKRTKSWPSRDAAEMEVQKLIQKKEKSGYSFSDTQLPH